MPIEKRGDTYYTVTELAGKLDVHRNSVIYWIKEEKIKAVRLGMAEKSPWMIPQSEVDRIMKELSN